MNKVITTENKPIKLWLDNIEDGALEQAKNLANLPFVFKHIAILSDSHRGYGMPIGAVMATRDVIVPNAAGSDLGCGMITVRTSIHNIRKSDLEKIVNKIKNVIPVGFKHHTVKQPQSFIPNPYQYYLVPNGIITKYYESLSYQIGTLGSGNHFAELQKGNDGFIWIMIHSGSRNIGYKVAQYYNKFAVDLNKKWYSSVPKKWELAFLPIDSTEGKNYLAEMKYCIAFAKANRKLMMSRVKSCIYEVINNVSFDTAIDVPHNYIAIEHHFGKNVMVHRKGATQAYKGQLGIIPGSQGTASYIVEGKGNCESFMSCSHGAGRRMGRKQAQRELDLNEQKQILDDAGVIHNMNTQNDLDEAPGSYKDITTVMKNQEDLVDIKIELKPLAVIKG